MIFSSAVSVDGSNFAFLQIGDVDAERVERLLGEILLPEADERHVESRRVESRNHPREQALHAVHARSFPAEMIADLQDVDLSHAFSVHR